MATKGLLPTSSPTEALRCFPCPEAGQHRLARCEQTRAVPFGTTSLPSSPGSHEERPGEEHGCQQSTARPAQGNAGRSHLATQKKKHLG